jgi:HPt (histidine-containing phosphotransfer) domain-containing protein
MTAIDQPTFEGLEETTGKDFVRELVDTFLKEAPVMLDDLRTSLAKQDAEHFRRAVHSLKSNANTFGALALGAIARDLEVSGVAQVRERGPDALGGVQAEYERVASELKELRG